MRERRRALSEPARAAASAALAARLAALDEWGAAAREGQVVAGFAAKPVEIDPAPALSGAVAAGAHVAYPRVGAGHPRVAFHLADAATLVPGAFGVREPAEGAPAVASGDVAVMIVPGLAFDAAGRRLGFGGGYYDEALGAGRPGLVVGVAYDFQVVPECPAGDQDARVDCVVTDQRVIRCSTGSSPDPAARNR